MSKDLISHYSRELIALRRAAAAFAVENPRVASRLRIAEDAIEDPHVERLIEAVAYLTARVRQKIDDDLPELTDALFSVLYPHYTRPIPSMSIVALEPSAGLSGPRVVERGTVLETESIDGEICRFTTTSDVTLHPVVIREAVLTGRPIRAPRVPVFENAAACLRIVVEPSLEEVEFHEVAPRRLRFWLRDQPQISYPLYELLFNDCLGVAFASGVDDVAPVVAASHVINPGGFDDNEGLLPYPPTAHPGYRLLTEFFAFPEKFLFVDIDFPPARELAGKGRRLELFFYFTKSRVAIERSVSATSFALGCTPVVNLFTQAAEPILLDQRHVGYRIVPDARRPDAMQIYSIERVERLDSDGKRSTVSPMYGLDHSRRGENGPDKRVWWVAGADLGDDGQDEGEVAISLVDLDMNLDAPADQVLLIETLCSDKSRAEKLPFGGGRPHIRPREPLPLVQRARLLRAPTPFIAKPDRKEGRWRLISHLALNHASIVSGGLQNLRELLTLYDFRDSLETRAMIDGVIAISSRSGTARVRGAEGYGAICRGVDVTVTFDETPFTGSVYLMASLLERFFGLYTGLNSFSRTTAQIKGRSEVLKRWPARAGDQVLL